MNNHKILWTTSIFKWIRILLCIVPLFVPSWTAITYDDVNFNFFINDDTELEPKLLESLETVKNFYALPEVKKAILLGLLISNFVPFLQPIAGTSFVLQIFLAEESDWRVAFTKTIADEIGCGDALNDVRQMKSRIQTIRQKFRILSHNNKNMENRKTTASLFHFFIAEMINFFALDDSLFRKYPLIGAPVLIELSVLILYFEPLAKTLVPLEANSLELSCKMRNLLVDYLPRTVHARLEKLHYERYNHYHKSSDKLAKEIFNAMSVRYNQYGYNKTKPPTLECTKGFGCTKNKIIGAENSCLIDDFGFDAFKIYDGECITDYILFLRHRVEKMFPVGLLTMLCKNPPKKTGFGWFTIKIKHVSGHSKSNGEKCDIVQKLNLQSANEFCDPYVKLFIDDVELLETPVQTDTCCYDLDVTYKSKRISKTTSVIKLDVYDDDSVLFVRPQPDLIISSEGSVGSFLMEGHRGFKFNGWENYVETISFWQDEYEEQDPFE